MVKMIYQRNGKVGKILYAFFVTTVAMLMVLDFTVLKAVERSEYKQEGTLIDIGEKEEQKTHPMDHR